MNSNALPYLIAGAIFSISLFVSYVLSALRSDRKLIEELCESVSMLSERVRQLQFEIENQVNEEKESQ